MPCFFPKDEWWKEKLCLAQYWPSLQCSSCLSESITPHRVSSTSIIPSPPKPSHSAPYQLLSHHVASSASVPLWLSWSRPDTATSRETRLQSWRRKTSTWGHNRARFWSRKRWTLEPISSWLVFYPLRSLHSKESERERKEESGEKWKREREREPARGEERDGESHTNERG